jgi:hypothetical protein
VEYNLNNCPNSRDKLDSALLNGLDAELKVWKAHWLKPVG